MKKSINWNKKKPANSFQPSASGFDDLLKKHQAHKSSTAHIRRLYLGICSSIMLLAVLIFSFYPSNRKLEANQFNKTIADINAPSIVEINPIIVPKTIKKEKISPDRRTIPTKKKDESKIDHSKQMANTLTDFSRAYPLNGFQTFNTFLNIKIDSLLQEHDSIMNQQIKIVFEINEQGNAEPIRMELLESHKLEEGLNEIVKSIPAWQPATANQKPVSSKFTIPITLKYDKNRIEVNSDH